MFVILELALSKSIFLKILDLKEITDEMRENITLLKLFKAPTRLFIYLLTSGLFLTYLRRPIGKMTVVEQQLEVCTLHSNDLKLHFNVKSSYRHLNSILIVNSEEISFYQVFYFLVQILHLNFA